MLRTAAAAIAKNIELIKAYAEGKTIEFKHTVTGEWRALEAPDFTNLPEHYRIKPEPVKYGNFLILYKHKASGTTGSVTIDSLFKVTQYMLQWKEQYHMKLVDFTEEVLNED